jgi:tRNA1Val (adenine37-N6)-methyltransferase
MPKKPTLVDPVLGPLTDDLLTPDVRVFQRLEGHRFSSDDIATAWAAFEARPAAARVLDLGCGLGSVLLVLAWKMPHASLAGIEAQDASFALLERNVARNGLGGRVAIHHGDLRHPEVIARLGVGGSFDLITGTPPYFPPSAAVDSVDPQRAYARIEYRGGIEAYLATGAQLLADEGVLVLCGDARGGERVTRGAESSGLHVNGRHDIIANAGRPPLFSVWRLSRSASPPVIATLTLRNHRGQQTGDASALRVFSGFAPLATPAAAH